MPNSCNPGTMTVSLSNGAVFTIYDYAAPEHAQVAVARFAQNTLGVALTGWTEGTTNAGVATWVYNGNNITATAVCDAGTVFDPGGETPPTGQTIALTAEGIPLLSMSAADGFIVSVAIIGVWASAFAWRAAMRALGGADENHNE